LMAIFLTIMADNRFGAFLCTAAFVASLLPSQYLRVALAITPFVLIPALLGVGFLYPDAEIDNSFSGRFLSSGHTLAGFDIWNWLGVGKTAEDWDSGYAYTISRIGIFGFAAFWSLFMALKSASAQFQMYRAFCGLYFAAILCVSYSPYTIKTASLLWFLLGTLVIVRGNQRVSALTTDGAPTTVAAQDFDTTRSR
jgi:putative polymerase